MPFLLLAGLKEQAASGRRFLSFPCALYSIEKGTIYPLACGTKENAPQYEDWLDKKDSGKGFIMLEWLKSILGDNYTEDLDKKVSEQIGKEFVSRADFNAANEAKKDLDKQLKDRDKQLDELKKVDATGLQAKITELQEANSIAKTDFETKLKQAQLDYKLDSLLVKEGAVNTKAVKALLDGSKISLDGENLIGVDEQLKAIKESDKWAFSPVIPPVPGGGNPTPAGGGEQKAALPKGTVIF